MKSICLKLTVVTSLVFAAFDVSAQLNSAQLRELRTAVIEMCRGGTVDGEHRSYRIEGSADGKIIVFKKLAELGADGKFELSDDKWSGIEALANPDTYADCVRHTLNILTPLMTSAPQPPTPRIYFANKNNCENVPTAGLGLPSRKTGHFRCDNADDPCQNDQVRSMQLRYVPIGTKVRVCDNSSCESNDDKVFVEVLELRNEICVPSFESGVPRNGAWADTGTYRIKAERWKNGIDGKISMIQVNWPGDS